MMMMMIHDYGCAKNTNPSEYLTRRHTYGYTDAAQKEKRNDEPIEAVFGQSITGIREL